jgi:hypothetical protein
MPAVERNKNRSSSRVSSGPVFVQYIHPIGCYLTEVQEHVQARKAAAAPVASAVKHSGAAVPGHLWEQPTRTTHSIAQAMLKLAA